MSTAAANSLTRKQLLQLERSSRLYEFLNLASGYLTHVPTDVEVRLAEVRAWARLGLGGVAVEQAERLPAALRGHPETAALIARLRGSPTGRVGWAGLRRRFESNLAAWGSRGGAAQVVAEAWRGGRALLELYRCGDGNHQLCRRGDRGERIWLPRLLDRREAASCTKLPEIPPQSMPPPYLIEGVDLGGVITRIWRSTRNTFLTYSPSIYVVEPNALCVAVAMHLHDWRELLADPRVLLFTGPEAAEQWAAVMKGDDHLRIPGTVTRLLRWGRPIAPPLEELIQQIVEARDRAAVAVHNQVSGVYQGRDASYWAGRYAAAAAGSAEPLRVLLVTSRFTTFLQYSARDIARAFEHLGAPVRLLIERDDFTAIASRELLETIRDFQPDMVMLLDHLRCEYAGVFPPQLPFVTWIQDMLPSLTNRRAGESIGPYDFVLGHGLKECVRFFGYPAGQFMPCQVPSNESTFDATPCGDEELAPYRCDVAYVGTGSMSPRRLHENFVGIHRPHASVRRVLETAYEMLLGLTEVSPGQRHQRIGKVLTDAAAACGVEMAQDVRAHLEANYIAVVADRMYRFQTLEWVADWVGETGGTFRLHGRGWEAHARLGRFARGPIENGEPLRRLYQAAKVNLHCNLHGTVHQRLLDGLCAGGFFLCRYNVSDFMYEPLRRWLAWLGTVRDRLPGVFRLSEHPALVASFDAYPPTFEADSHPLVCEVTEETYTSAVLEERVARRGLAGHVFPDFERVTFKDRAELFAKLNRFLGDDEARRQITRQLRESVISMFTYAGVLSDLLAEMAAHFRRVGGAAR